MRFFTPALSLALAACSALAQETFLTYPHPGATLTAGSDITVQVGMEGYPENIDVVAIVVGLAQCPGGKCYPASNAMGNILYQGPYIPEPPNYYANYIVKVPQDFPAGPASLNVINLFMVGASYVPVVDYLNENVTVAARRYG